MHLLASCTGRKRVTPPPAKEKCKSCLCVPKDDRYWGHCEPCYEYRVEMAFQSLPPWPIPMDRGVRAAQCLTCDLRWPAECLFRDSRGIRKCVVCRRWELMHGVEMHPGVPIHLTLGPERGIRCFKCGKENQAEHHKLGGGVRSWPRTSLFCSDCRHLEARYAAQGLVNIAG